VIETTDVVKRYGTTIALDNVSLRVEPGAVYGLVGSNGAGKTTLLGLLAGIRLPTSGSVHIGIDRRRIAVLPDTPRFDPWLTGSEVVALARRLGGGEGEPATVAEVIHDVGLDDAADRAVGGYSRGMLQRLGVAATVVGSPGLLILDEPASALDPLGRREVLDLVSRLRGSATVLFSSHILADVQEVCDTVGVLDRGRLLFQGRLEELLVGSAVPRYVVRCRPPVGAVVERLRHHGWITGIEQTGPATLSIAVTNLDEAEHRLPGALAEAGARVVSLGPEAGSLERAFLELTR